MVIVNTCGFIEAAKEQSIETILEACAAQGARASSRRWWRWAAWCSAHGAELRAEIPEVDLFMGLTELQGLVPELRAPGAAAAEETVPVMERPLRILASETPHTSYLKISEGCDHTCAFCAIPLMRGLHRSAPLDELVREAAGAGRRRGCGS